MNMLRHIAQNNGVVTDGNLRMIQELVDFLPQNSIKTSQTEFRKLVAVATPSNDFHNPFLSEEEAVQQPVQRILFPSTPVPRKRSRLIDELEAEEDSELDAGQATRLPVDYPYIIEDMWTVDGEKVEVSVLCAANQAVPVYSTEVAQVCIGQIPRIGH
ncbi:hypothetical protein V8C34DRAFT_320686 [Trichoderma compactum]